MCSQYDKDHEDLSFNWADMMEMTDSVVRMPGRALEMHQKLSSPSRKKSRSESVKRSEEKMVRFLLFIYFMKSLRSPYCSAD